MNRVALGLAIGAGYVLGRTRKMKLALAVGTAIAGKRKQLNPRALTNLFDEQLRKNPELKAIGDQLRKDLRGVGSAASGALVERQIDSLADRLHGRTEQVRERLSGVAPEPSGEETEEEETEEEETEDEGRAEGTGSGETARRSDKAEETPRRRPAAKAPSKTPSGKSETGKRPVKKAPGQQGAVTKTTGKATKAARSVASKTTAGAKGGVARATRGPAGEGRR